MTDSINSLYIDVLGRNADPDGEAHYQAELDAGKSLDDVRRELAGGDEAAADIDGIYEQVSGQHATGGEIAAFQYALGVGGIWTLNTGVRWAIGHSGEATAALTDLFQQVRGQGPSASDVSAFEDNVLGLGGSLADVRSSLAYDSLAAQNIQGIYQQVLGRAASAAEVGVWQGYLAGGGNLAAIRSVAAYSAEAAADINTMFVNDVGRAATASEEATYQYGMSVGGVWTLAGVQWSVANSAAATSAINSIYQTMLGHPSNDPALLAAYETNMGIYGWTLATVTYDLAHRPEAAADIQGIYQQGLSRDASADELAFWQNNLASGNSTYNISSIVFHSDQENAAIEAIYQQVLGRTASSDAVAFQENQGLAQGLTLAQIRQNVAYSPEAAADIVAAFASELGQPATSTDFAAWEGAFANGSQTLASMRAQLSTYAPNQITVVYLQMLGRLPTAAEIAIGEGNLAGGASLDNIRNAVAHSAEAEADFDAAWYLAQYPDVAASGVDPYMDYVTTGWREGRNPNAYFDTNYYLQQNPDVAANGVCPLFQYRLYGWKEGRDPSAEFSTSGYLAGAPDVAAAGVDPLQHYLLYGRYEGRPVFMAVGAQAQIQGAYQQGLGRAATGAEVAFWENAMLTGAARLPDIITLVLNTGAIQNAYQQILGRAADTGGLNTYLAHMAQGWTIAQVREALATSSEGVDDLQSVFNDELGRPAITSDLTFWEGQLSQGASMSGVQLALSTTAEAKAQIQATYNQVLGRSATDDEIAAQESNLASGLALSDVQWLLASSDEAAADVQTLYVEVLGRLGSDDEVYSQQGILGDGTSLADLRTNFAHSTEAANDITGIYQSLLGRPPTADELAGYQTALGSDEGWTLEQVAPAVADTAIDQFYRSVLARDALPAERDAIKAALIAGESLPSQFAFLRANFALSSTEAATITAFYDSTFGRDATSSEIGVIEAAVAAGQSLQDIEHNLTPAVTEQIKGFYEEDLGRAADWPGLSYYTGLAQSGVAMSQISYDFAYSAESAAHIQAIFQQDFGRAASASEVAGWQMAETSGADQAGQFTVSSNTGTLAITDARTIAVEAATYVTLSGGLTPTLTGADGQVFTFRNATELAAFALATAYNTGQSTVSVMQTYSLAVTWLAQVGQADIQAAAALQAMSAADFAAGSSFKGYAEGLGAQLAMKIQQTPPANRQPLTIQSLAGQWLFTVTVTGDVDDPTGQAGFSYSIVDTDPVRTQLLADAQAEAALAVTGDAGNQFLAMLDNEQARIDVALAALPAGARSDKMLGVAQQFVDAARAAAAQNNWNLVQTLETAADVSLQIAAMPVGSRVQMTERFIHENVKHDITVNPNAADPFASFTDHSKGEDVIGAIVEAVVGVVINVLAFIPATAPVFAPLAVAWDTAQAGEDFSQGNILGGVINLASAIGVGLSGLDAVVESGLVGETLSGVQQVAENTAEALGFVASDTTAATQLGQTILAGVGIVGGASGIAQSASHGDALGIAAGALQIAAAAAGGLISTSEVLPEYDPVTGEVLSGINAYNVVRNIAVYAGLASTGLDASDAFANGNLAGGLASSLNALEALTFQVIESRSNGSTETGGGGDGGEASQVDSAYQSAARIPVTAEDLPPVPGYGYDGLPLPVPPMPPPSPPIVDSATAEGQINNGLDIHVASVFDLSPPTNATPNAYARMPGESDEDWIARLSSARQLALQTLGSDRSGSTTTLQAINLAIATDPVFRANYFAALQKLSLDAFNNPSKYGVLYQDQNVGSGFYNDSTPTSRIEAFIGSGMADSISLRIAADGKVYDFGSNITKITDGGNPFTYLSLLMVENTLSINYSNPTSASAQRALFDTMVYVAGTGAALVGPPGGNGVPTLSQLSEGIGEAINQGGRAIGITKGPTQMANPDPELGPAQVRLYVNYADEFGKVTNYSVNYDPVTGKFGTIKPSSGPR